MPVPCRHSGPRGRLLLVAVLLVLAASPGVAGLARPSAAQSPGTFVTRLPLVYHNYRSLLPFGVESNRAATGTLLERATTLGTRWFRLHRVSWRAVQPAENGPYDWSVLASNLSQASWIS